MMRSLNDYKRVFYAVGIIGIILCFLPTGIELAVLPSQEQFSELYVLGPQRTAGNYPFNISADTSYTVYLDVVNHMGRSMYYEADVKIRNESEPLPNNTVPSTLPALYEYNLFLSDGQGWESALTFSFNFSSPVDNNIFLNKVQINGINVEVDKTTARDNSNGGYYYQLIVELREYNPKSGKLSYDGRFVTLWLNMTQT
jgi:hypothetical protein